MKRLFWERLAWLWVLCIPLAVAGGIGYGGQAYNPQSVAITGGTINNTLIGITTPAEGKFTTAIFTAGGAGFSSGTSNGIYGSNSASGIGVYGTNTGTGYGVYGDNNASNGFGVYGTNNGTGVGVFGSSVGGYGGQFDKLNTTDHYDLNGKILFSSTMPTIASGFGTGSAITNSNGTSNFSIIIGSGGTDSTGVLTFPAATNGWHCLFDQVQGGIYQVNVHSIQQAFSTTTVNVTNYNTTTGAATPWTASYSLNAFCQAF